MKKELLNLFKINRGILKTAELLEHGYTNYQINRLLGDDIIERVKKGYYKLADHEMSDLSIVLARLPDAVICFDTALFYYGYSDRTPNQIHIAVNKDISKAKVKFDYPFVKTYYVESYLLELGVVNTIIEETNVRIYTRDRLICDCLMYEKKLEIELFNKAITNYIKDSKKNISKLLEYAKVRGVEKKVYDKIGMWL